jgi:hypothetical protein
MKAADRDGPDAMSGVVTATRTMTSNRGYSWVAGELAKAPFLEIDSEY